jgi:hypothetical protein
MEREVGGKESESGRERERERKGEEECVADFRFDKGMHSRVIEEECFRGEFLNVLGKKRRFFAGATILSGIWLWVRNLSGF